MTKHSIERKTPTYIKSNIYTVSFKYCLRNIQLICFSLLIYFGNSIVLKFWKFAKNLFCYPALRFQAILNCRATVQFACRCLRSAQRKIQSFWNFPTFYA